MWPTWLTRHIKIVEVNSYHIIAYEFFKPTPNIWVTRTMILEIGPGRLTDIVKDSGDNIDDPPYISRHTCAKKN